MLSEIYMTRQQLENFLRIHISTLFFKPSVLFSFLTYISSLRILHHYFDHIHLTPLRFILFCLLTSWFCSLSFLLQLTNNDLGYTYNLCYVTFCQLIIDILRDTPLNKSDSASRSSIGSISQLAGCFRDTLPFPALLLLLFVCFWFISSLHSFAHAILSSGSSSLHVPSYVWKSYFP